MNMINTLHGGFSSATYVVLTNALVVAKFSEKDKSKKSKWETVDHNVTFLNKISLDEEYMYVLVTVDKIGKQRAFTQSVIIKSDLQVAVISRHSLMNISPKL